MRQWQANEWFCLPPVAEFGIPYGLAILNGMEASSAGRRIGLRQAMKPIDRFKDFEQAISQMAADPQALAEIAAIQREFRLPMQYGLTPESWQFDDR